VNELAAVESRVLECTDLRSNPTMRRGPRRRLVEREQKAEHHLVATAMGSADVAPAAGVKAAIVGL
jgi:hypothetical protein